MKDKSNATNGGKYVTMPRTLRSSVGLFRGGILCTALTLGGSGCAPSLSYTHPKKAMDGCLTTLFFTIECKAVFMRHFISLWRHQSCSSSSLPLVTTSTVIPVTPYSG